MVDRKYIVVTGGVMSGLGKGVATASIGRLLRNGSRIITIKCDGYLNSDPGTMAPAEHGEVYVLDSGREVDMDFGHYERFMGIECKGEWNLTMGSVYSELISSERKGEFLGATVQMHPHVIDFITDKIIATSESEKSDITLVEIGGCTDDDETQAFINMLTELKRRVGRENFFHAHLTFIDYLRSVGELKTRLAQRDLNLARSLGIMPDLLLCRSEQVIDGKIKAKLARMGKIDESKVISSHDVAEIYQIPLIYNDQDVVAKINEMWGTDFSPDMVKWKQYVDRLIDPSDEIKIAICGKYTMLKDSYASIFESLRHAGAHLDVKPKVEMIDTTDIKDDDTLRKILQGFHGIIVPGGFGSRGAEGKIRMVQYARENRMPYLGLCYGLQLAVVEYARNVCGLEGANTTENEDSPKHPVITFLPGQDEDTAKGGTMRLGAYPAELSKGSLAHGLYQSEAVHERHRHRYEVNPEYHDILKEHGLIISGVSPDGTLAEFIELPKKVHPFFAATQAHPEFKSRLEKPAPLFYGFVKAALERARNPHNHNI